MEKTITISYDEYEQLREQVKCLTENQDKIEIMFAGVEPSMITSLNVALKKVYVKKSPTIEKELSDLIDSLFIGHTDQMNEIDRLKSIIKEKGLIIDDLKELNKLLKNRTLFERIFNTVSSKRN